MLRRLYLLLFKISGWKVVGSFPVGLRKYIIAVAPHTSNWDFVIGVMARSILHLRKAKFLGKSQLFRAPYGWFFRWLGGYPVERSSHHDMVQQVVNIFDKHEDFVLAIAPEGTRKKVQKMKTGFYFIALKASVPIIPVGFDFHLKQVVIGEPFYPTGDLENDLKVLLAFYSSIKGKNPELGIQ